MGDLAPSAPSSELAMERLVARARLENERARFLARTTSAATRKTYEADLRHFFEWLEPGSAGVPSLDALRAVTWREVSSYRDRFYLPSPATGRPELSPATGARRLSVLSSLFRALVRAGVLARDPTEGVRRPRVPDEGRTRGLSPEEVDRVLALAPQGTLRADRDRLFLALLFFEWLRISEAVRLRVEDFGSEGDIPFVRVRQKGGKERRLALHPAVAALCSEHVARHAVTGFLFPSLGRGRGEERPISTDGARRLVWRPAVLRAGLDPDLVTPHSARVAGITAALLARVPLEDVQDHAGHARPETTLRYHRARRRLDRSPVGTMPYVLPR